MALKYLPANYLRIASVSPGDDKKLTRRLTVITAVLAVAMVCAGRIFVPFSAYLYTYAVTKSDVMRTGALIPALLAYTVLYTLLRMVLLKKIGGIKPALGVSGISPYVSSGAYLNRREFTAAALAPPAVFALIYFVLNLALPVRWFWFVYFLQMINITGAVCEVYTVWYAKGMMPDVLILDGGTYTEFYARAELVEK